MTELLQAGLNVTLMGMGVVFVLLTLLVGVVQAMSQLCRYIEEGSTKVAVAPTAAMDEEIVSAIGAAIASYRRKHNP